MCVATGYLRPNARRLGAIGQHKGLATLCLTFHVPSTKYRVATNTTQWRASKEKAFACCDSNEKLHLPTPRRFEREPRVRRSVDRSECASDDAARTNGKQLWPFLYTIRPHKAAHSAFRTRVPQETLIRPLLGAPRHSSKRLAESACQRMCFFWKAIAVRAPPPLPTLPP